MATNYPSNLLDFGLMNEKDREAAKLGGELHQADLRSFDTRFQIARGLEILRAFFYGKGDQGAYRDALMQFGYTNRDRTKPLDPAIRNDYQFLLNNEAAIRAWWNSVSEANKDSWHSVRAIVRNFKNCDKPKGSHKNKKWGAIIEGRPLTEEELREVASLNKPSPEAIQARMAANAEAEAEELAKAEASPSLSERNRELERIKLALESQIKDLEDRAIPTINGVLTQAAALAKDMKEQRERAEFARRLCESVGVRVTSFETPDDYERMVSKIKAFGKSKAAKTNKGKRESVSKSDNPGTLNWSNHVGDWVAYVGGGEFEKYRVTKNGARWRADYYPGAGESNSSTRLLGHAKTVEQAKELAEADHAKLDA